MNVWCHLPTIINRRYVLHLAGILTLCVALITTLFFSVASYAAPGVNQTISFQGRLLNTEGVTVPDGYYNIQFKIYQDGTGTTAGNPGGTLMWTETYNNNGGNNGVHVKNGYLSVNLGSKTPFGTSVDWNQDTLWLSMNIAGSSTSCSTFNTAPCVADGEMLPMKRMTSTPFAINSAQVGGKTANQLVQLGQGTQTDASNNSSIAINKTGTGNLIQLQNTATDVFTVTGGGDILLGSNSSHSIGIATAPADSPGLQLTIAAGAGGTGEGSAGGTLRLHGGDAGGTDGNGGDISIDAGAKTGTGSGGSVAIGGTNAQSIQIGSTAEALTQTIAIGTNNTAGSVSNVTIGAGSGAAGGATTVQAKDDVTIATDGTTRATFGSDNTLTLGNGETAAAPNDFVIQGTSSTTSEVSGGSLTIQGGSATVGDTNGGNITLSGGSGSGSGAGGLVIISTPTFSTTSDDANCFTSGALVAASCSISTTSINSSSVILVGFSETEQTATLPDPTITTAGRIIYVTGAAGSETFVLSMNGGGDGNEITLRANGATTLLWNGMDWVVAGASTATALQDKYDSETDTRNVQIGDSSDGTTTLLTLDRSASAPVAVDNTALLGSMYYDTTLGKVQCYEVTGWGSCGSSPDTYITLSPEYSNAVINGDGEGDMSTDLCSDALNINDGSGVQPTICGTNETYTFYNWTSTEGTEQSQSIYVTYQLPGSFKEFAEGLTSLKARTNSSDASVDYQIYRSNEAGLIPCGSAISVSTGEQTAWQTANATVLNDPANCGFEAGDSMVIKITLASSNGAHAYVSNLNFTYANK